MNLHRRTLLSAAGPVALGGLLAGCFTSSESDGTDRLRIAMAGSPNAGLSPHSEDAFKLIRWSVTETLLDLDDQALPVASLAVEWTRSAENAWELTLREGVLFHDGSALDAEAAAACLNAAAAAAAVPRVIDGVGLTAEATGDLTLAVATAEPDPVLPQRLSSPQLGILSPDAYSGANIDPVGHATGPFQITESTGTGATLERFEDYWGEAAALDGFAADYVPDAATRVAALRSGETDVIEAVPYAQVTELDEALLQDAPTIRTVSLYLNTDTGPLAETGLRAAAAAAIDPALIVDDIYEGRADAPEGLFGPAMAWAADHRDYELPEAGTPAGQTLRVASYTNRAELPEALTVIASQLEAAGFEVETDVRDYTDIEPDMLAGEFDAFLMSRSVVQDSGDAYTYLESDFTSEGGFNVSRLADPAVDETVGAVADLTDTEERRAAILDAEAAVLATAAVVPVAHERLITGVSERVSGVAADPRELRVITAETSLD